MSIDIRNLKQRILSAAIIAPIVLLFVYAGGAGYFLIVTLVSILGLTEWLRLVDPEAGGDAVFLSYAALLLTVGMGAWHSACFGMVVGAMLMTAIYFFLSNQQKKGAGWISFGIPYTAGFALALFDLRSTPGIGRGLVFYVLAVVWATDIGAYAAGRLVGGPKLAPFISPNKTWAGLIGGALLAVIVAYVLAMALGAKHAWFGSLIAGILACIAQIGDLFESWIKRRAGVKESGDLIPGHGGLLDRIDGLIFAAILFAIFQATLGDAINWW